MNLRAMVATVRSRCADSGSGGESLGTMMVLKVLWGEMEASLRCCWRVTPKTVRDSVGGGV